MLDKSKQDILWYLLDVASSHTLESDQFPHNDSCREPCHDGLGLCDAGGAG